MQYKIECPSTCKYIRDVYMEWDGTVNIIHRAYEMTDHYKVYIMFGYTPSVYVGMYYVSNKQIVMTQHTDRYFK